MRLALVVLATVLHYTVPMWEAPQRCDRWAIFCDSTGAACETVEVSSPERMAKVQVWWGARWGDFRLLREKSVAGLEGQPDTIQVPDDTVATVYLVAVDSAGNASCPSNHVTVNSPLGVAPVTPLRRHLQVRWYDVAGRRLPEQPRRSGVYFRREAWGDSLSVRRIVVLR